jgi:hypothetical protein
MITDITNVSDKDVIQAAVRSVGGIVHSDRNIFFTNEEVLMKCVTVLRQLYPGHLLADAVKCDGNHGGPACADPDCWQSPVPVVMHPKADPARDGSEPGLRGVLEMLYDVAFQDGESPDAQRVQRKELAVELAFRTLATPEQRAEPDMRAVCEALGFDPTNHHNAAKCPYCREQRAKPLPELVVTRDGKVLTDQRRGLQEFMERCEKKEPQQLHQAVWPSVASEQCGQPVEPSTPPWMDAIAHAIADRHESTDHGALKEAIIEAMKEASREVALYFAANPKSSLL